MSQPQPIASGPSPPSAPTAPASRPRASWPLIVLAWAAAIAGLYFAQDVMIPVVLAALLALLLRPILRRLRRLNFPDGAAALLLVGCLAAVFVVGVWMLAGQAQHWLAQAPQTVERVRNLLPKRAGPLQDLQQTSDAVQGLTRSDGAEPPVQVEVQSSDLAYALLGVSGKVTAMAVIVFVLGFFLLAFSESLLRHAVTLCTSFAQKRTVVQAVLDVENGISRYLLTISTINAGLGVATGLVMWALGIPSPLLWGVLAATANYVPHVGAFVCMLVLFFVGAVSHESLGYGLLTAGAFVVLTSAESYFVTPLILSRSLQLSPLAVILAILFGGWLWGIAGIALAMPLVVTAKALIMELALQGADTRASPDATTMRSRAESLLGLGAARHRRPETERR
ncbi:MAG TPA: AI-2E family transporter [Pirellulaceae bacterium]|nr:AI-2E family transporter [Pirellulaceae bacterium]